MTLPDQFSSLNPVATKAYVDAVLAGITVVTSPDALEHVPRVRGNRVLAAFETPPILIYYNGIRWVPVEVSDPSVPVTSDLRQPPVELTRQDIFELLLGGYLQHILLDPHRKFYDLCINVPAAGLYHNGELNTTFSFRVSANESSSSGKFQSNVWVVPHSLPHQRNQVERACLFLRPCVEEAVVANPQKTQESQSMYTFYFKLREGLTDIDHY